MDTIAEVRKANDCVVSAHGGGGEMMARLIDEHVVALLGNETLNELMDGAVLPCPTSKIILTTDSFVVQPLEFPGGDIGRLAVCGTINDLAVMGGRPLGLSLGLILEEGLEFEVLDRVLRSIRLAAEEAGVHIVTGDTKVIEHGAGSGMLVNTAGVAAVDERIDVGFERIEPGDSILINGTIGDHGMAVMSVRNGLEFETDLVSDAAPLHGLVAALVDAGVDIRFMRDATRGGVAGVLADVCDRAELGIEIDEVKLPRNRVVHAAAGMLGFDLLTVANEGKIVFVVPPEQADLGVSIMKEQQWGVQAARIGMVVPGDPPLVELVTETGGRRIIQRPYGEELPRIC